MNIQRRKLRLQNILAGGNFDLPEDWRFVGISPIGTGVVTITNGEGESIDITESTPFNMYLPSESFESLNIACDGLTACNVSYFK